MFDKNKKVVRVSRKLNVCIKTYKLPVDMKFEGCFNPLIEFKPDMVVKVQDVELEGVFKLTEIAQSIQQYNSRQVLFCKKAEKDTINQKRITKKQ